jgi:AraC family transcriptional regulator of adaptative response/methylated-DNA-[protein]-cysteine methyltransferase
METNYNTAMLSPAAVKARITGTFPDAGLPRGVVITGMRPEEAPGLTIRFTIANTAIGEIMLASTAKGICYAGFTDNNPDIALADLRRRFPKAVLQQGAGEWQQEAWEWFNHPGKTGLPLHLHVKGTAFQQAIWKKLLTVPAGTLTTYAQLGGGARMARAAGTAVGNNPVAFLIPCHRAVRSNGQFEGYFWGPARKKELLALEARPNIKNNGHGNTTGARL